MEPKIETIDFTKYVPYRNVDRTPLTYKPRANFKTFMTTAGSASIPSGAKRPRRYNLNNVDPYEFFKARIIKHNPLAVDLDWSNIKLFFKQKVGTTPAKIILRSADPKYKTKQRTGIEFNFTKLLGEDLYETLLDIPARIPTRFVSEAFNACMNVLGVNGSVRLEQDDRKDTLDNGFTQSYIYIKPPEEVIQEGAEFDLSTSKTVGVHLSDLITLQQDSRSAYTMRVNVLEEPSKEWYRQFKTLLDLRNHAYPLINEYMEYLYFTLISRGIRYDAKYKRYVFPGIYDTVNIHNPTLLGDTPLPTANQQNAIISGIAFTNGYFNNVIHNILFTLSSSTNQADIGNGRGDYRYSNINDRVISRKEVNQHPEYEHYFLFYTYDYVTSGLEGLISPGDADYDTSWNYYNFYNVGGYRKYVIDLATCTLYSSTHYWHPAKPTPQNRNSYTATTIGFVIPIDPAQDMILNIYEYAKELYLASPLGKLSEQLGYRKTDTSVGER